jgi:hypothetical protein
VPGDTSTSVNPDQWTEIIVGQKLSSNRKPKPIEPQDPLGKLKIHHWGYEWRVGGSSPASGVLVSRNALQKYRDHAISAGFTPAP